MGESLQSSYEEEGAYRPDLYAALLFARSEQPAEAIREFVRTQEMTHIAEGIELKQLNVRYLECDGDRVLGFGNQDIEEMAVAGYDDAQARVSAGEAAAQPLVQRRAHDITIAQAVKQLAITGEYGQTLLAISPYAEELPDDEAAAALGHWPRYRRSFMWLYRKVEGRVECTDITIDQSQVSTYRALLQHLGTDTPPDITSHDLPGHLATVGMLATDDERLDAAKNVRRAYYQLQPGQAETAADNEEQEALEFLQTYAYRHLSLLVDVHEAVGATLQSPEGELHSLVRLSADIALRDLTCLDDDERRQLSGLLAGNLPASDQLDACITLIRAQRYGIWQAMNSLLKGEAPLEVPANTERPFIYIDTEHEADIQRRLQFLYANTNQAADDHLTMPGCAGGTSFLKRDQRDVQNSIFGEDSEDSESQQLPSRIRCIKCHQYSPREQVVGKNDWHCPKCQYQVDICTGAVLHESVNKEPAAPDPPRPAARTVLSFCRAEAPEAEPQAA